MPLCQNCGKDNAPTIAACAECGTPFAKPKPKFAGTMLGMPSPTALEAGAPVAQPLPPTEPVAQAPSAATAASRPAPTRSALAGTMIGMPSPVASGQPLATQSALAAPGPEKAMAFGQTMVGVGSPGMKYPAAESALPRHQEPPAAGGPPHNEPPMAVPHRTTESPTAGITPAAMASPGANAKFKGTLLGIAQPGIAPTEPKAGQPSAPPRPPSFSVPQSSGDSTGFRSERGEFPTTRPAWINLAMIGGGMAIAGAIGGAIAFFAPQPPTVTVTEFSIDDEGNDTLRLACTQCPDGATLHLGEAVGRVKGGEAQLRPTKRLALGRNELQFKLQVGTEVKEPKPVVLPIAFRVLTDFNGLHESPPYAEVTVMAPAGSAVTVNQTALPLRGERGVHRVTFAQETSGESAKSSQVQAQLSIVVVVDGKPRPTTAELRNGVTPLTLESPSPLHHLGGKPVAVSGRTAPLATVKVGALTTTADAKGAFTLVVKDPKPGKLVISSFVKDLLSRRVEVELSADAPVPAGAVSGFADLIAGAQVDLAAHVIESRTAAGTTQALLEVDRGCAAPPCLVRAVYGEPKALAPDATVRITGVVAPGSPLTIRVRRFL